MFLGTTQRNNEKTAFTLIELVMIIVIIALLAVMAVSKYFDLKARAEQAKEDAIVGAIRAGIQNYLSQHNSWPERLEADKDTLCIGRCCPNCVCFNGVLTEGIIDGSWSMPSVTLLPRPTIGTIYTYCPEGKNYCYNYNTSNGSFEKVNYTYPFPMPACQ